MRKRPSNLPLLFIIAIGILSWPSLSKADWYNASWSYRRSHVINSATGAGTNYQVKLLLYYGSGTSGSNDTIYLDSHTQTDFDDIRFTASDGTTLLDYWIEEKVDSNYAKVWVEISADISSSTTTIYLYYGNSGASSASNGANTFLFFDDFSGDLTKWTVEKTSDVYPRIESGVMRAGGGSTGGTYGHTSLGSSATFSDFNNNAVDGKLYLASSAIGEVAFRGNFAGNTGYKGRFDQRTGQGQSILEPPYSGWAATCNVDLDVPSASTWYTFSIRATGSNLYLYRDDALKRSCSDSTYSSAGEIALQNHYGSYTDYDDIRVRKFVSPEPTQDTWGSEEMNVVEPGTLTSSSYKIQQYSLNSGSGVVTDGSGIKLNATLGEVTGADMSSALYQSKLGYPNTIQANVPAAPTLTNTDNEFYNKLHIVIDDGSNPSDTVFAIAISSDDFTTTYYVQSDHTISQNLGIEDYQTYSDWDTTTGIDIIGLTSATEYKAKVKAMHGDFTETDYSPTDTESTIDPYLNFDIDVSSIDEETDSPFTISFGDLTSTNYTTATNMIWTDFQTNGESGGRIYGAGQYGGLWSESTQTLIDSISGSLAGTVEGYGLQVSSMTQTYGTLVAEAIYDHSDATVGEVSTAINQIVYTTGPLRGGRSSFTLKARITDLTPAASDYEETLTVIAAASF